MNKGEVFKKLSDKDKKEELYQKSLKKYGKVLSKIYITYTIEKERCNCEIIYKTK